jgi:hypothetical protein
MADLDSKSTLLRVTPSKFEVADECSDAVTLT